jgi:uncharacterized protein
MKKLISTLKNKQFYTTSTFWFSFYFALLTVWTIRNYTLSNLPENLSLQNILLNQVLKATIWVLPIFLIIKNTSKESFWESLGLDSWNLKSVKITILISLIWFFINLIPNIITTNQGLNFNWIITKESLISAVIAAPFIEEIMFRGFLLQKAQLLWGFWPANIITSLSFVIIHWPRWFFFNEFNLFSNLYLFVFSIICGIIVKYGHNKIWGSVIFHGVNNYLASI